MGSVRRLIITADDYGYAPAYDRGILEAARAGAVDAVSAFASAGRGGPPGSLLETGVEIGLHLELPADRRPALAAAGDQLERFEALYGRAPAYLDGHHHCHAAPGVAAAVGQLAHEQGLAVRSVDQGHRRLLRRLGLRTPDRLVGRLDEGEPGVPAEIQEVLSGGDLPDGVTEWVVHPGRPDPAAGSAYDTGREQDFRLLLQLADDPGLRALRATHAEALLTDVRPG